MDEPHHQSAGHLYMMTGGMEASGGTEAYTNRAQQPAQESHIESSSCNV